MIKLNIKFICLVLLINSIINANPVKQIKYLLNENSVIESNNDISKTLSEQNKVVSNLEENNDILNKKSISKEKIIKDDKNENSDIKNEKKNEDEEYNTKIDKKDNENNKSDNDEKADKNDKNNKDNKDDKIDKTENDVKNDKNDTIDKIDINNEENKSIKDDKNDKNDENKEKESDDKKFVKIDEKLDDNQKELKNNKNKVDDSSEENDSHSNPETEEEGDSYSESDEDDKLVEEEESERGKNEKKLLIILVSGFRYDYIHIKKLNTIKKLLENGVRSKYLRPAYPSNSYPNYYSLMTGLHPIKHGFVDNELYDTKYKEYFSKKYHDHKHWWNKVEPLWISAIKNKLKVATFWWKGACNIIIKTKKPKNCVPYKEKVSTDEVEKHLEYILDQFEQNKLDLALLSYDAIDKVGHLFGPDSHKLRIAVRKFDSILQNLTDGIENHNLTEILNVIVVSDHGMIGTGLEIRLEEYIDFNDIEKFVNTGTFCMLLPENKKENYIYNLLQEAKIKGLNIYKKPNFPKHFHFKKNINDELILPIVLSTDKGFYIKDPNLQKKLDEPELDNDNEQILKGIHGYDALHVKEMNTIMFGFGPDLEKNKIVKPIDQVDLYNLFCKLLNIKPLKNDGDEDILDNILHEEGDNHDIESEEENETKENNDSNEINGEYGKKIVKDEKPIFRSRWASRGGSSFIKLNYLISMFSFFFFFYSLVKFNLI